MSDHTPGPWRVAHSTERKPDVLWINAPAATGVHRAIAEVIGSDDSYSAEDEANARLIAAAPDLLEAARNALAFLAEHDAKHACIVEFPVTRDLLVAAIAKAEGR